MVCVCQSPHHHASPLLSRPPAAPSDLSHERTHAHTNIHAHTHACTHAHTHKQKDHDGRLEAGSMDLAEGLEGGLVRFALVDALQHLVVPAFTPFRSIWLCVDCRLVWLQGSHVGAFTIIVSR